MMVGCVHIVSNDPTQLNYGKSNPEFWAKSKRYRYMDASDNYFGILMGIDVSGYHGLPLPMD